MAAKPGFRMPSQAPRSMQEMQEFIEGAGKPSTVSTPAAPAVSRLPWEGVDDQRSIPGQPLRLTAKQHAALSFVTANRSGYRSRHAAIIAWINEALRREIKELTGEDITFTSDEPKP